MIPTKRRLRPDNRCSIHQTSSPARSCIFFYAFSFIYRTCVSLLPQLYTKVASAKNGLFQKFNIGNGCPVKRNNKSMKCSFNWNAYCHLTIGKNPLRIEMWNIFTFKPTKLKSSAHQIDCKRKEESFNNTIFYTINHSNFLENLQARNAIDLIDITVKERLLIATIKTDCENQIIDRYQIVDFNIERYICSGQPAFLI